MSGGDGGGITGRRAMQLPSQLVCLSVAAMLSLLFSEAHGYCISSRSSRINTSAATSMNFAKHVGKQHHRCGTHRCLIPAGPDDRWKGHWGGGWVAGEDLGRTNARRASFNQKQLGMMGKSGAPPGKGGKGKGPYKVISNNKKARRNYEILEKFEAGIELVGSEVKSCRMSRINMDEGFAQAKNGQCFLHGVHIAECEASNRFYQHEPRRPRRLLLHKVSNTDVMERCVVRIQRALIGRLPKDNPAVVMREIKKLQDKVAQKGMTVVPLKIFFNDRNRLKVEIALALGKNVRDKRADIKDREAKRDMQRIAKNAYG